LGEQSLDFKIYLVVLETEKLEPYLKQSEAIGLIETILSGYNIPGSADSLKEKVSGVMVTEQRGTKDRPDDKYKLLDADYPIVDAHAIPAFSHSMEKDKLLNRFSDHKTKVGEYKKQDENSRRDGVLLITDSRTIGSINDKLIQRGYSIIRLQSSQTARD